MSKRKHESEEPPEPVDGEVVVPKPNLLALRNPHEHDSRIEFFEGKHLYVVDNDRNTRYMSVTKFNGNHFEEYNVETHAKKIMSKREYRNDPNFEFYKKSLEYIVETLTERNKAASAVGTGMHSALEHFYNDMEIPNPEAYTKELKMFHAFVREKTPGWKPFRTEWEIFAPDLQLAGSVDMVFETEPGLTMTDTNGKEFITKQGDLVIVDWKRCTNLDSTYASSNAITECINHMPNTKISHYTLQLNTYKMILEKYYGKRVVALVLVGLHPEQKKYLYIQVPFIPDEMAKLVELRLATLREQEADPKLPPVLDEAETSEL